MSDERRRQAVAGSFYPADPVVLRTLVADCLMDVPAESRRCKAVIVPHAGLIYSGKCAGAVFGRVAAPRTTVIVAPNHTGAGRSPGASLWRRGVFETPLGDVTIDAVFSAELENVTDLVVHDPSAHRREHAIEVELPFLRVLAPEATIVPIVLAWDEWPTCERLAAALARVIEDAPSGVLLVASSDMTHYESAARAKKKDGLALDAIARLDGRALLEVCHREEVTMCGRAPAAVVVEAARLLGATKADVVDYRHSGLVSGDHDSVVAYAGVVIT